MKVVGMTTKIPAETRAAANACHGETRRRASRIAKTMDIAARAMPISGHAVYMRNAAVSVTPAGSASPRNVKPQSQATTVAIMFTIASWSDEFTSPLSSDTRNAPDNNQLQLTRSATVRVARPSQLNWVLSRHR